MPLEKIRRIGRRLLDADARRQAASRAVAVWRFRRALLASPPLPPARPGAGELHTIAGRRSVLEAIGTAKSFNRFAHPPLPVVVHDDGTIRPSDAKRIGAHLPGARVVYRADADREVDALLARRRLERCRVLRRDLVFALKLFDVPFYAAGQPVLYTDSDVLFYSRPEAIFAALASGRGAYNEDVTSSYAWPPALIERELGVRLTGDVNAGLLVLHDIESQWEFLEHCLATLPPPENLYYVEQTLNAILMARRGASALPPDYDVCFRASWQPPSYEQWLRHARGSEARTSQHFCGGQAQRSWYYRHFVSEIAPALRAAPSGQPPRAAAS